MEYNLSLAEFQSGKMFDSNRKFIHKTGNRFKLFPFVTQPNSVPVEDLDTMFRVLRMALIMMICLASM